VSGYTIERNWSLENTFAHHTSDSRLSGLDFLGALA
jgi:hypothetical protein